MPQNHHMKLVGMVMVKAILLMFVLLISIWAVRAGHSACVSSKAGSQGLLFVSCGKLSLYVSSFQLESGVTVPSPDQYVSRN